MKISKYIHAWLIAGVIMLTPHAPLHAADLMTVYRDAQAQDAQYAAARAAYQAGLEKLPQGRAPGWSGCARNRVSARNPVKLQRSLSVVVLSIDHDLSPIRQTCALPIDNETDIHALPRTGNNRIRPEFIVIAEKVVIDQLEHSIGIR